MSQGKDFCQKHHTFDNFDEAWAAITEAGGVKISGLIWKFPDGSGLKIRNGGDSLFVDDIQVTEALEFITKNGSKFRLPNDAAYEAKITTPLLKVAKIYEEDGSLIALFPDDSRLLLQKQIHVTLSEVQ